jgi:hypothetical protein
MLLEREECDHAGPDYTDNSPERCVLSLIACVEQTWGPEHHRSLQSSAQRTQIFGSIPRRIIKGLRVGGHRNPSSRHSEVQGVSQP